MATTGTEETEKKARGPLPSGNGSDAAPVRGRIRKPAGMLADEPLWFKDVVTDEAPVKAFFDAIDDGVIRRRPA